MSKALEFYEVSAKKGSVKAHKVLARFHERNGDIDVYIKHLKVVASAGDQDSMDDLLKLYKNEALTKDELTQTLRAFQASCIEMKNKDRHFGKNFTAANGGINPLGEAQPADLIKAAKRSRRSIYS